jgi:hypothetical protein
MEVQSNSHLFRIRLNDERTKKATISSELAMRITKIVKLKHRYESFAIILNTDKSDEENILTQAQYVIKVYLFFFNTDKYFLFVCSIVCANERRFIKTR